MNQLFPVIRRVRKPLLPVEPAERQKAGQSGLTSAATGMPVPLGQMEATGLVEHVTANPKVTRVVTNAATGKRNGKSTD